MPRFAANLSMMFNEVAFLDRFEAAANAGFKGVEILFPYEAPKEEVASRLNAHGLEQVLFNLPPGDWDAGERGLAAMPGREDDFKRALGTALDYAQALKCPRLHAMPGLVHHGARRATYVENLAYAAREAASASVDIIIEPINTRDVPGFFLNRTEDARAVIHEVGAANLGLQFDLYHRQIQQGDVATALCEFIGLTKHMQIANPPDRGEPDQGEMHYAYLFKHLDALGYDGWVGCEYRPRAGTLEGLGWVEALGVSL